MAWKRISYRRYRSAFQPCRLQAEVRVDAIIDWLIRYGAGIVVIVGGLFAFIQWIDQRNRELSDRRFEQYWKLLDTSQSDPHLAHQKISLLLLKRYPEFKDETLHFLM